MEYSIYYLLSSGLSFGGTSLAQLDEETVPVQIVREKFESRDQGLNRSVSIRRQPLREAHRTPVSSVSRPYRCD